MMQNKLRIAVIAPGLFPEIKTISGSLESMQKIVEGFIEVARDDRLPGMLIVCNDEGKINDLRMNRKIFTNGYPDYIMGTFFVCADGGDDFISLTDEQIETVRKRFRVPFKKEKAH